MKEISKYLHKFMISTFGNEIRNNSFSPKTFYFFSEKYKEILYADSQWQIIKDSILSSRSFIDFSQNNSWKEGEHFGYLEDNFKTLLENREKIGVQYLFKIFEQDITLYIVYPIKKKDIHRISRQKELKYYETIVFKIYLWLHIANKYRNEICSKTLNIYIYLTDLPKLLPNTGPIGRSHVNTGFTTACSSKNEIYVFREEEWFKVFIHETFHAFGLEFIENICENTIKNIFHLPNVSLNIFETYNEIWALSMNILFYMHFDRVTFSEKTFMKLFQEEIAFSNFQCAKVLNYYSMNYSDLYSKSPESLEKQNNYEEKSNVFAYYVLKSILLNHLNEYIVWVLQTNQKSFKFAVSSQNISRFCLLFENQYRNPEYIRKIDAFTGWLKKNKNENNIETKTLRMTLYEC
jgi:hypothetical protein